MSPQICCLVTGYTSLVLLMTSQVYGGIAYDVPQDTGTEVTTVSIKVIKKLYTDKLSFYDKKPLPRYDQDDSVEVNTSFILKNVLEFDTLEQRFTVLGFFRVEWYDHLLSWNASLYGGLNTIRLPTTDIWMPKLTYLQAYSGDGVIGELAADKTKVSDRGLVQWVPDGTYSMVCLVDIRYFPFDVQHCSFEYYIATENSSSVILNNHIGTDLSVFTENAEWKLIANDVVIREKHGKNFVDLRFTLKRRGDFIMFTVVAPLFMLSFLNGCVFIVPIDSGEKGAFAITVFLSYFVFVTIIMDTLPHNSLNVSMFIIYIVCLLSVSVLLVLYSIVQSKMFHACGENECPFKWMQSRGVKRLPEKERPLFTWTAFLGRLDIYLFAGFLAVVSLFSAVFTIGIALRL